MWISGIRHTRGDRALVAGGRLGPAVSTLIRFDVDFERLTRNVTEPSIFQGPTNRALLLTRLPRLPDPRDNAGSSGFLTRARETNLLGRMRWSFAPRWTLTADAGLSNARRDRRLSMLSQFDPVAGTGVLTVQAANGQLYRNFDLRADVSGSIDTGPFRHELIFGVSTQRSRQDFAPPLIAAGFLNPGGCIALWARIALHPECLRSDSARVVNFAADLPYDPTRDTNNVDSGLYLFDRIGFGGASRDRFQLIAGARQSWYSQFVATAPDQMEARLHSSSADRFRRRHLPARSRREPLRELYRGHRKPASSAQSHDQTQAGILPPGRSRQKEVGAKFRPTRALLINFAYFDIDRRLTYVNSSDRFVNDGTAHYRGIEAGLNGDITPNLSMIGSAMLLDAREDVPGDPVIDGKRVENSARLGKGRCSANTGSGDCWPGWGREWRTVLHRQALHQSRKHVVRPRLHDARHRRLLCDADRRHSDHGTFECREPHGEALRRLVWLEPDSDGDFEVHPAHPHSQAVLAEVRS